MSVARMMVGDGVMVFHLVISSVTVLARKRVLVEVIDVVATRVAVAAQAHCCTLFTAGKAGKSRERFLF